MKKIKNIFYYTITLIFLVSNRLLWHKNQSSLFQIYNNNLFKNFLFLASTEYLFTFDLWYRFSKANLRYFKKVKRRRVLLPTMDNIHLIKNFLKYSGLKFLVGKKNMLPIFISNSGLFSPYLLTKNKKSFWKSSYWSFLTLNSSFQGLTFSKFNSIKIVKSNLLINQTVNIKLKIIKNVVRKRAFKMLSGASIKKLHLVSRIFTNSVKLKLNMLNYFILNEFNYLIQGWRKKFRNKKKKFNGIKTKKFRSIWDYKRSTFFLRHQRSIIRRLFFIKGKNYVISTYVQKLYRTKCSGFKFLLKVELKLYFSLLRSKMCLTFEESNNLIQNGLVYINNKICKNKNFVLSLNDRVQVSFSRSNFVNFRYAYSDIIAKKYKLSIYNSYKLLYKKRNRNPPQHYTGKWIYKSMFDNIKVPKYMEVDYLTLTYIIVFMPYNIKHIFAANWKYFRFLNVRYYNWKYLY